MRFSNECYFLFYWFVCSLDIFVGELIEVNLLIKRLCTVFSCVFCGKFQRFGELFETVFDCFFSIIVFSRKHFITPR